MANFEKFDKYDWDQDAVFQQGIASIVSKYGTDSDAAQKARFWYFAKYVEPIDIVEYQNWKTGALTTHNHPQEEQQEDGPRYPKSFFELCDMLAKGIPVPGIKQIPDQLAQGEQSQPELQPRPKPWQVKEI
jgi:hypothetical protein